MLKVGSCATAACEPRQVRKEAAVSKNYRVPQVHLTGVNYRDFAYSLMSKVGARSFSW